MIKKSTSWANEESFKILVNEALVKESPAFVNSATQTFEYCISGGPNHQYTLRLFDSVGDSWSSGSWLEIRGLYNNVFFKGYLTDSRTESYSLSLYFPIKTSDQWKMTSGSITTGWTAVDFNDQGWTTVTLGSVASAVSGTQYFRKTFMGLSSMAAYELALQYRMGIVFYINGVELYRDNMPDGEVQSSTLAIGSYPTLQYRKFLRSGSEVAVNPSVFAIEIHFITAGEMFVDFDAWMALYTPSTPESICYVYGDAINIQSSGISNPSNLFDFGKGTFASIQSGNLPATITFTFLGSRPMINGIRVWPSGSPTSAPSTFSFEGSMGSTSSAEWSPIVSVEDAVYQTTTVKPFFSYFNSKLYSSYRAVITSSFLTYVYIYEMQPMVCNVPIPTSIQFEQPNYSFYAMYEEVNIRPVVNEWQNCQVTPQLPQGLTMDASCHITGRVMTAQTQVQYQVTSQTNGQTYQGNFYLRIMSCSGMVVTVLRTYKSSAFNEAFTIKDASNQEVVLSVETNSGQINNNNWERVLCLTGSRYTVTLSSNLNYWQVNSFLYVNAMLSGDEYETLLRAKYDADLGLNTELTFNAHYIIPPLSQWYYLMGQYQDNWYDANVSGWTLQTAGSFPASTNQIQMYKRIVNIESLSDVAGFVISLRYLYGCYVYVNGNRVFSNNVPEAFTASTTAMSDYDELLFHQISLPIKTIQTDGGESVNYLTTGQNTIAIALVAISPTQQTASFDCAVRLMGSNAESRVYDYAITSNSVTGATNAFSNHYSYSVYYTTCAANYLQITFNNDRREWISSLEIQLYYTQSTQQVRTFSLKGRNSNSEQWTPIKEVQGIVWSIPGQSRKIWLENNKPYNQYRFDNFTSGSSSACYWKFSHLDLFADNTNREVPPLTYPTISVFKQIEMAEVFPSSSLYSDFSVNPPLPDGLTIDPYNGMISGTPVTESAASTHTVTARKMNGGSTTATVAVDVSVCTGGKSLITLVVRTDSTPLQASYKLYRGKQTQGTPVSELDHYRSLSALNYADFCLSHDIYALQLFDSSSNGWANPAGYYLTVDLGAMRFETGQMPSGIQSKTILLSSLLPFQINYDDWKLYNLDESVAEDWNQISFDDSTWLVRKANAFDTSEAITVYVRRTVSVPNIDDYQVLNVRVRYTGGIAAYFNGRLVARFNLEDSFNKDSTSLELHDANTFSVFHVILPIAGGITGNNVIGFEIHRPVGTSSASPIVFDATGVFGVNECSAVLDTYINLDGKLPGTVKPEIFFDMSPVTYSYLTNSVGSYLKWTVENLEGSKWNSFGLQTVYARTGLGFSVYAQMTEEDDEVSMVALLGQSTLARDRTTWSIPVGIAGFRHFRYEIDAIASSLVYFGSVVTEYCKATGSVCEAMGDYPAVANGQISPGVCSKGYRGYSYRTCTGTTFSDVKNDKCVQKVPAKLQYAKRHYTFVADIEVATDVPSHMNIIESFYLDELSILPDGLHLDEKTGKIYGTPKEEMELQAYTVYGKNSVGTTMTTINIQVKKGECLADGVFPKTPVGTVAEYQCSSQGSYVGTQKRACVLGATNGEWMKATGFCMSMALIVILIFIVIVVIVLVVFLLARKFSKAKAVGGVKGSKKNSTKLSTKSSSKKGLEKKTSQKAVKVCCVCLNQREDFIH